MLDEYRIIDLLRKGLGELPKGFLPIGDDVAVVPPGKKGESVVTKIDTLVGRSDVPQGMSWAMAARKAVAACVSDFAAKGARPTSYMVSLGVPRGTGRGKLLELASGFREASKEWEVLLVGGDVSETDDLIVSCSMLGFARKVVERSGAGPGEYVVVGGSFGLTLSGLRILMDGAPAEPGFRKAALTSVYRPTPNLKLGQAVSGELSSSIDSSDGLAISLNTICEMSGVGMRVARLPLAKGVEGFASRNSFSAEELCLYGGEEYALVGTVTKSTLGRAITKARGARGRLTVIGETFPRSKVSGVALPDGRKVPKKGWVKFRGRV